MQFTDSWSPEDEQIIARLMKEIEDSDIPTYTTNLRIAAIQKMRRLAMDSLKGAMRSIPVIPIRTRHARGPRGPRAPRVQVTAVEAERYFDRRPVARAIPRISHIPRKEPEPLRARDIAPRRNPLTPLERREKVKIQRERCIYCSHKFGSSVFNRRGSEVIVKVRYDHFEPFRLRENNSKDNIFAACQICNSMKSDYLFDTLNDVRKYVEQKWQEAGYTDSRPLLVPFRARPEWCNPN